MEVKEKIQERSGEGQNGDEIYSARFCINLALQLDCASGEQLRGKGGKQMKLKFVLRFRYDCGAKSHSAGHLVGMRWCSTGRECREDLQSHLDKSKQLLGWV